MSAISECPPCPLTSSKDDIIFSRVLRVVNVVAFVYGIILSLTLAVRRWKSLSIDRRVMQALFAATRRRLDLKTDLLGSFEEHYDKDLDGFTIREGTLAEADKNLDEATTLLSDVEEELGQPLGCGVFLAILFGYPDRQQETKGDLKTAVQLIDGAVRILDHLHERYFLLCIGGTYKRVTEKKERPKTSQADNTNQSESLQGNSAEAGPSANHPPSDGI